MKKFLLATAAALLLPGTAYAMPAAIGGIGALVGGAASGVSLGSIAIGIASMGAQWLLSKMMAPDQKQRGIKTRMETGGDNPPSFIVGEYATSGQLVYANTKDGGTNIPESLLVYVICLSTLPIEAVSNTIYINNEKCTIDTSETFSGFYAVNEYVKGTGQGGYCSIKFHLGDQSSADNWLMDNFGNDPDRPWDNDFFLPGCAYAVIRCWYSNRGIWTGLPEFRFTVKGAKFYDPRKDSTVGGSGSHRWNNQNTWQFTRNPKVIEYNIVRGLYWDGKHYWGGRAEAYRLPLDYWFAAMNVCDENIERKDGETINRYEIGAEISLDDKPLEVINEINKSCDGYTTEYGGTYKTWCGGFGLSVGTITDDDWLVTAELETNRFQPRQNTYNTAYTTYPEPKQQWEVKDGPRYQDDDAVDEDGEELALDLALPFVSEANQAQRVARAAIKDSRRQVTHAGQLPPFAYVYEPFDRLTYVSDMFGYTGGGKDFIVATKEDLPNVNQQILLREINPDDHAWLVAYEQDWEAAPLVIVGATDLALDVDVFADEVESTSGKDKPAIRAEWDWGVGVDGPGEVDVRYIDWRIRRAGATKIIARGKIEAPEDDEGIVSSNVLKWGKSYDIQFRAVPFGIRASAWTTWKSVTMASVDVPTGLVLTQETKEDADGTIRHYVKANWNDATQENSGYGIRITIDGDDRFHRADSSKYKFAVKAPETVQVSVRTRATDGGTPSDWCTPASITVTKKSAGASAATGLTATAKPKGIRLRWTRCSDNDYKETIVYRATSNSFGAASEIDRIKGTWTLDADELTAGTTYYYWVAHVNRSDNTGTQSSVASAAYKAVTDGDTDQTALGVPTGLALTQLARDVDLDGKVDIAIKATWTAVSGAKSYALEITQGSDVSYVQTDDVSHVFRAKGGKLYSVKVRSITFNGTKSALSSAATLTTVKKSALPTTAAGLTATAKPKGIRLRWSRCTDSDYKESIVYRNTANSFGSAVEIDRVKGTSLIDSDELTAGTTYYYWVAHLDTSGNEGAASASANATYKLVVDGDTDATAPSTPSAPTLVQVARDVDEDGKVDIAIKVTWSAATGAKAYELEITQGSDVSYVKTKSLSHIFKAKSNKLYSVKVSAISFNGTASAFSTAATITPVKKSSLPTTAAGLAATAKPKGNRLRWTKCPDADYAETIVYRHTANSFASASAIDRVSGTSLLDSDELTAGTTYYYWVSHVDTSGNEGAQSSVASATYKAVADGDTDGTVLAAPSGLALNQAARDVDGDGKVDIALLASVSSGPTGTKNYEFELSRSTTAGGSYTVIETKTSPSGQVWFKANTNFYYKTRARVLSFNGTPGTWSSLTSAVQPAKKSALPTTASGLTATAKPKGVRLRWTKCPDADYAETIIYRHTSNTFGSASAIDRVAGTTILDADELTAGTTYYYWVCHVDRSGNIGAQSSSANATWKKVTDDDTDSTALAAPSGLDIDQDNVDLDDDGKVDIAILVSWTDSGSSVKSYEVELSRADTAGGSYTVIDSKKSKGNKLRFPAKSTKHYKARIRAFSFNGTPGTWSSLTSAFQPVSKSAAPSTPSWEASNSIVAKPKAIWLRWQEPTDKDYKKTVVYRNTTNNSGTAVEIGRVAGTRYQDTDDDLTAGTTYYYWLKHLDTSGNLSGSFSSVKSIAWKKVEAGDTDGTVLGGPTGLALALVYQDIDGDGSVDTTYKATWSALSGAVRYEIEVSKSDTLAGTYTVVENIVTSALFASFRVVTGKHYKARIRAFTFNGTPGNWSSLTAAVQPTGVTGAPAAPSGLTVLSVPLGFSVGWNSPPELDYWYSQIAVHSISGSPTSNEIFGVTVGSRGSIIYPVSSAKFLSVRHINTSGLASAWTQYGSTVVATSVGRSQVDAGASGAIAVNNLGTSNSGSVNAGDGTMTLLTLTFKCTSTTTGVTINLGGYSTTVDFKDQQPFTFTTAESGGGSFSFSKSGGGTQANVQLTATTIY